MSTSPIIFTRPSGAVPLRIIPTPGKLSITPASRLCFETLDRHPELLEGDGIDWGSGSGILAITAATTPGVDIVVGLDLERADVATARTNAELNGVAHRTSFIHADLFLPFSTEDVAPLKALRGRGRFLIANPPASSGDDGLGWRRAVLDGAAPYLAPGAEVLLQVSHQYGAERISGLGRAGYEYVSQLGSSEWVPFDMSREDLHAAVVDFAAEEARGGAPYEFLHPEREEPIDATTALALWQEERRNPLSRWQMHHLRRLTGK